MLASIPFSSVSHISNKDLRITKVLPGRRGLC